MKRMKYIHDGGVAPNFMKVDPILNDLSPSNDVTSLLVHTG